MVGIVGVGVKQLEAQIERERSSEREVFVGKAMKGKGKGKGEKIVVDRRSKKRDVNGAERWDEGCQNRSSN